MICKIFGHKWIRGKEGAVTAIIDLFTAGYTKDYWHKIFCKRCCILFDDYIRLVIDSLSEKRVN